MILLLGIIAVIAVGVAIVALIEDDLRRELRIDRSRDVEVLDLRRWRR